MKPMCRLWHTAAHLFIFTIFMSMACKVAGYSLTSCIATSGPPAEQYQVGMLRGEGVEANLLQDDVQSPEDARHAAHARPQVLDLPLRQPPRGGLACTGALADDPQAEHTWADSFYAA